MSYAANPWDVWILGYMYNRHYGDSLYELGKLASEYRQLIQILVYLIVFSRRLQAAMIMDILPNKLNPSVGWPTGVTGASLAF